MNEQLQTLRNEIDKIDSALLDLLAKRFAITQEVGELKMRYNLSSTAPGREKQIFEKLENMARERNLNPDLVRKIWRLMIDEVVKNHEQIKNNLLGEEK